VAPSNQSWTDLKTAILAAFQSGGGDFNAGRRTFGLLRSAGMQFANSLRKRIIDGSLLSEAQLDACLSEVAAVADDPDSVMTTFIVTQVAGREAS
jgi:hypothetical protein